MRTPCLLQGFLSPHLLSGLGKDAPVLVALSGGADSVALLTHLVSWSAETGAPLSVAHVNHKLRGLRSDADRDFCRALAEQYRLPFYLLEVDVGALAKANRRGIEEQARLVRYEFFASLMETHNIPLLATAHHADDNAETVLLHMVRGSGLHGLCGIAPVRDFAKGSLIRPLLSVTKEEILAFCEQNGIAYVTDATNDDTEFARNRIRHNVIPELRHINPAAVNSIARLCRAVTRDDDFIHQSAREFLSLHTQEDGGIPLSALRGTHPALASRVVSLLLADRTESLSATHIEAVLKLALDGVPHSSLDLGNGIRAIIENGFLLLSDQPPRKVDTPEFFIPLHEGENPLPEAEMLLLIEQEGSQKNHQALKNIYKKSTTTRISSATIDDSLFARPRREGDVILTRGMHKRVKKLMCDCKLPLSLRGRLPLICCGEEILWVPLVATRDGESREADITVTLFYND